jgi:hypothetical protein
MSQIDTSAPVLELTPLPPVAIAYNDYPASASNDAVPIELIDEVISYIRDDHFTLQSCSLVCKAWIPLSRQHLFYSISLDHSNISEFIALLELGSGSSVGPLVQHLRIHRRGRDPVWVAEAVPILSSYLHPASLELCLHNSVLPQGGLGGGFYKAEPLQIEDLTVFHNAFRQVVHLNLSMVSDSFAEGAELLASFPLLETLDLRRDWYRWSRAHVSYDTMFLPNSLRSISTSYGYYMNFFQWLFNQPHPPRLSSLSLASNKVTASISSYIQSLGATLHHLSFHPNFPGNSEMYRIGQGRRLPRDHIDLTHNPALRSITLHPGEEVILTALQVLSQIRSNDMEKVAIIVTLPLLKPFDGDPNADLPERWAELDDLFSTSRFSKLREVIISIPNYSFHDIERLLPLCKIREILHPYHSTGDANPPYVILTRYTADACRRILI